MTKPHAAFHPPGSESTVLPSIPEGVDLIRLDNGLELILAHDASAPVVSAQAWCRAGSIDEGRWLGGGLSHVLEHMLFKGTETRGSGRIDQEVQAAGGYMNAYTSFDRTVYWINVPNTGARVAVDILTDILQHATLPADELASELDVIRREMAMGNDDPGRFASRRLFETAYTRSPYRFPIIGLPDIFNRLTREDIAGYYREKYAPNNCFLVVVGDFDPEAVRQQVTEAFAGTPARSVPPSLVIQEPRQAAPREVWEERPVELAHLHLGWHVPDIRHPDTPVLDVLATLLGSGRSSRLYRTVREQSALAHSVSGWLYTPGPVGVFGVSAVCDGNRAAAARDEILAEVERMRLELVSSAELAKAVRQFLVSTLSNRKTMEGQAQDLGGSWMAAHDLNFSARYLEAVRRVTPEDIRRVAADHLVPTNQTVYGLLPEGTRPRTAAPPLRGGDSPVRRIVLSNGLRVLVKEDHRLPFVDFRIAFSGGLPAELPETAGITTLAARVQAKGTTRRSAESLALEIEGLGGSLEPYSGNHTFGLSAEFLSQDFAAGLDLFIDVLRQPSWPAAAIEREREVQLAAIRGQRDQLLQAAFKSMRRTLFGNTGYGLDPLGTEATIGRLQAGDLLRHYQRLACPANGVLAVFGDVHAEAVEGALESALKGWETGHPCPIPPPASPARATRHEEERDKEQAVLVLGFPGSTFRSADRYALDLLQEACSDMGSRLFLRIRDELGLAYYVGTQNFLGQNPGAFSFYCGTAPEQVDAVEFELRQQAALLAREGLTAAELERAKAKVVGQRKIARQELGALAMSAALDELYGLGFDHGDREDSCYQSVTLEDIREAAARHFVEENAVLAIIRGTASSRG